MPELYGSHPKFLRDRHPRIEQKRASRIFKLLRYCCVEVVARKMRFLSEEQEERSRMTGVAGLSEILKYEFSTF
jgi:hypothetical protein